jgi:hypothetical protein
VTAADAEPSGRVDRGRRGLLTASAVALGAGVAVTATACQSSPATPVGIDVVARSVLAKLATDADPRANTDALNAAMAESATSGAHVILPGGEFGFVGMALPPKGAVNVVGAGRGITMLRNEGTAASITAHGVPGGDEYLSDWAISGLSLSAVKRVPEQVALSVKLASRFSVRDLLISGHGVGVQHESGWDGGYDGVSVTDSGIGWQFPAIGGFAPSSPLGLRNCSAVNSDTAVSIEDGVEAMEWVGGDFSGCGRGMLILGDETRSISLHGINFERIKGEDLVVGDDKSGPAAVAVNGCRFFRVDKGAVSVRFVRGDALTFGSSRWTNYGTAVDRGDDSGLLVINTSTGFEVDDFLASGGQVQPQGVLNASAGPFSMTLSLDGTSVLPAVAGVEGLATKFLSGPGRVTASDGDFAIPPREGSIAVLRDDADGSIRHAVRGTDGWFVSAPYQAQPPK